MPRPRYHWRFSALICFSVTWPKHTRKHIVLSNKYVELNSSSLFACLSSSFIYRCIAMPNHECICVNGIQYSPCRSVAEHSVQHNKSTLKGKQWQRLQWSLQGCHWSESAALPWELFVSTVEMCDASVFYTLTREGLVWRGWEIRQRWRTGKK